MSIEQIIAALCFVCAIGEFFFANNISRAAFFMISVGVVELYVIAKSVNAYVGILCQSNGIDLAGTKDGIKKKGDKAPMGFQAPGEKD